MSGVKIIHDVNQLREFVNKNGIVEIALRGKHQRFKAFQKISLENLIQQPDLSEKFSTLVDRLNARNAINIENMQLLSQVSQLSNLNLLINGLNLCATCVGFAMISSKMDEMSNQIKEVLSVIKQTNNYQLDYEFQKCVSQHEKMLDHRKTQDYLSLSNMEDLVSTEYNVLNLLINCFMTDIVSDKESLLFSIMSLASMFSVSLKYYDEMYYFNYSDKVSGKYLWHTSHDKWLSVFEKMTSEQFVKNVQDYGVLTLNLPLHSNDAFYVSVKDNILNYKQDILDNQKLLTVLNTKEKYDEYFDYINNDVKYEIYEVINQDEELSNNSSFINQINDAMRCVGIMI